MGRQSGRYVIGAKKLPAAISWNSIMHVCNIWPHLNHTFHAYSFMAKRKATISRYVVLVVLSWRYIHPRMLLTCSSKSRLMIIMGWQFCGRGKSDKVSYNFWSTSNSWLLFYSSPNFSMFVWHVIQCKISHNSKYIIF